MTETKDASLNSIIKEFNELAPKGKKLTETSTFVGGSVPVGTARTIANFSCEVFTSKEGVKHPWLAVRFTDGTAVSLRSLMGLPSMEGFSTEGVFSVDEFTGNTLPTGEKETTTREVEATAGEFDPAKRFVPSTWCVNDFLNEEAKMLIGAKVTYWGTALKPYTVRKPFDNQVLGGRAVISVGLWEVTPASTVTAVAPAE